MTTFAVALLIALPTTGLLVRLLRRQPFIDLPNHRSSHDVPTPRGGGLAVLLAVVVALAVTTPEAWPVLVPVVLLGLLGLADDVRSLSPSVRLIGQLLVALGVTIVVGLEVGDAGLWLGVFLVIGPIGYVGYVNAFNFMDGVNGISALNAAVAGAWFVWLGSDRDLPLLVAGGAALAGAALGFLPWNARSQVFLGDVGSYAIGALVATLGLTALAVGVPGPLVLAPLVVYIADTAWAIMRRVRSGDSLTQAHRDHVYQRLVQRGWPHLASAAWTALLAVGACFGIAVVYRISPALALLVAVSVVVVYLGTPRALSSGGVAPTASSGRR